MSRTLPSPPIFDLCKPHVLAVDAEAMADAVVQAFLTAVKDGASVAEQEQAVAEALHEADPSVPVSLLLARAAIRTLRREVTRTLAS